MKLTDEGALGPVDPEQTEFLPIPGAVDDFDDDELLDDSDEADEPTSLLVRSWRRVTGWLPEEGMARHLTYAGAAAAVVVALIGVLIVTGGESEASDEVADAANSEMTDLEGTQSYDDFSQLLPSAYETSTTEFPIETTPLIGETPLDVPLPGDDPAMEFSDTEVPLAPSEITVTETAEPVDDPYATETETVVETPTETITTPAPSEPGSQWPNVSLNGSVSVQVPTREPGDRGTAPPSTVTVTVPAETTTAPSRTRTTTPRPTSCVSTPSTTRKPTTTKPTTTTPRTTTRTPRPTTTTPRPKPSTTTPKKTTTTVPPCR
ncbi:hypothetical protein ACTWPB_14770 [Nocardia sp. IBHARD005]|uniref:hypothetical protein n=1 Tax=Nocardia sp. IBHARD005 TaxID=3457765 RepID=UPI004058F70C